MSSQSNQKTTPLHTCMLESSSDFEPRARAQPKFFTGCASHAGSWLTVNHIPTARVGAGNAVVAGNIFSFGGFTKNPPWGPGTLRVAERYTVATGESLKPFPLQRIRCNNLSCILPKMVMGRRVALCQLLARNPGSGRDVSIGWEAVSGSRLPAAEFAHMFL